jgi:hypothetical protein
MQHGICLCVCGHPPPAVLTIGRALTFGLIKTQAENPGLKNRKLQTTPNIHK